MRRSPPVRPTAAPQPVYLNGTQVGQLGENQVLNVPYADHQHEVRLRLGAPTGPDDPETQTYRRAVQLVVENKKASTSWLQRQLRVGYNGAARLIERMEKAGIISTPDHVGRREVLIEPADLASYL